MPTPGINCSTFRTISLRLLSFEKEYLGECLVECIFELYATGPGVSSDLGSTIGLWSVNLPGQNQYFLSQRAV